MRPAPAFLALALATAFPLALAATAGEAAREVVFLAEDRPIFLRLRVTIGDRPFDDAWSDSVHALHACLDRDGDGKVTTKEADKDKDALAALVRLATGGATTLPPGDLDVHPKDGVVSTDELAEALRPVLGPFRVQVSRLANGRTDALFDHLDRDKDGLLTRSELAAITGSLRRLDLDDNEMISADELEPFTDPAASARADNTSDRRARFSALPPVVELVAGESSLRLARLLMKKYDKGRSDAPEKPDNKLSLTEFAINPAAFAAADKNGDETLNMEELRRYLAGAPVDLLLEVAFSPDASGRATARVGGDGVLPKGVQVRQLADGDFEFAVGRVRLDVHVDGGETAAENARRVFLRRFEAADANKDGYLEGKELAGVNAAGSPLAGLTGVIDRDGDGKLYAKELSDFVDRQTEAARGRLVLTTSDQGRAIFGILDLDRDRRLSAREVMRTVERVTSWDGDSDGRVSADEIPYHFLVTLTRGELSGLAGEGGAGAVAVAPRSMVAPGPARPAAGPDWFRQMDRNRDGDISRREFLGPREQFDRLDRDKDGLIDPEEAGGARASAKGPKVDPEP
jgi:Ca2+-binding EF-hand superfamily protein